MNLLLYYIYYCYFYIDSLDNDMMFADITKSVTIRFRFDSLQGLAIDMR